MALDYGNSTTGVSGARRSIARNRRPCAAPARIGSTSANLAARSASLPNFSNTPLKFEIGLPQPGVWHVRFNSDDIAYSPDFGGTPSTDITTQPMPLDNQAQLGTVQLGSYSVVILSQ